MQYRVKFEKVGLSKYISHLDLNRLFMRAVNRAGINIAYSEGFNPHQKITFASTLSLGVESYCELVDIKTVDSEDKTAEIFESLSRTIPNGINIKKVYVPENAFKNIAFTRYNIFIKFTDFTEVNTDKLREMFAEDVLIEKKSKTKTDNVVINKYIESIDFYDSGFCGCEEYLKIDTVVKTGNEMYLNPEYIVRATGAKFEICDSFIVKIVMLDNNYAEFM